MAGFHLGACSSASKLFKEIKLSNLIRNMSNLRTPSYPEFQCHQSHGIQGSQHGQNSQIYSSLSILQSFFGHSFCFQLLGRQILNLKVSKNISQIFNDLVLEKKVKSRQLLAKEELLGGLNTQLLHRLNLIIFETRDVCLLP